MIMARKKTRPAEFVLDCSVTVAWFFEDETDDYAESVQDSLAAATAIVPSLWRLEVANALVVGERRKRTTEAKITAFLAILKALPIGLDDETWSRAWQESLSLAREHNLSVYDAAYLELALRRNVPLASIDDRLNAAAATVGVARYKP
jgi:predicted nucleic acid-binding protein